MMLVNVELSFRDVSAQYKKERQKLPHESQSQKCRATANSVCKLLRRGTLNQFLKYFIPVGY